MRTRGATVARVLQRAVRAHVLIAPAENVVDAVRRAAGVYGSAPTSHLSLLARTRSHKPSDLLHSIDSIEEAPKAPVLSGEAGMRSSHR